MKILLYIVALTALAGCIPTGPMQLEDKYAPGIRKVGYPMGGSDCVLQAHGPGVPTVVTDSGARCEKTRTTAGVLEWRWTRDQSGVCGVDITRARRVYGCIDQEPI